MKKILVIAPSADFARESSFRIRILALRDAMARRGFDWVIKPRPRGPIRRLLVARSAKNFDAVILQRKMFDPYEARALRRSIGSGKIFLDIDDAIMYHETQLGAVARRRLDRRFDATLGIVDCACAGNEYLADIFRRRGRRAVIVPTVVAPELYPVKVHTHTASPRLVWIGSGSTIKYLEQAMAFLGEKGAAAQFKDLRLVVICDRPPAGATLPVDFRPWSLETESRTIIEGDIGIAPTPEDRWTLGKCGFKIVQYMAAGLPVVASPVGANVDLVKGGGRWSESGLLANNAEEWIRAIVALAGNAELRGKLGAAGRLRVEQELCVEKMADRWAQVLT